MSKRGLEHTLDLGMIFVPWEKCETASVGENPGTVLARLRRRVFDQAPIVDETGCPLGLALKEDLEDLRSQSRLIEKGDSAIRRATIGQESTLAVLIQTMSEVPAVLVADGKQQADQGPLRNVKGLLTLSDLNKAPVLASIFVILAEIETTLAQIVDSASADPWEWIQKLNRQRQAQVLGYWELAKKRNVDAGAISSCNLGDLVAAARKTDGLKEAFRDGKQVDESDADRLRQLRNRVMHPVAPLVTNLEDVRSLGTTLRYAVDVLARMRIHRQEK